MREFASPPSVPVSWTFRSKSTSSTTAVIDSPDQATFTEGVTWKHIRVTERTWFAARKEAARILGVAPEDLELIEGIKS